MNATLARSAVALALLAAATSSGAAAPEDAFQTRAVVVPAAVRLGEPASYRGRIIIPAGSDVRWLPPEPYEDLTWGKPNARRGRGKGPPGGAAFDTLEVDASLQVFRIGDIMIPGLRFQIRGAGGTRIGRLPLVRLQVASVLTAADSNATLRPLRGPIAAPWWERVPWRWVLVGVLVLAAGIVFIRWWRKRKRPAPPVVVPVYDPAAEALAALVALRGLNLPAHGRFAEHAFHLSQIARRFLEATARTPRPGDTTSELLRHLEGASLGAGELERLEALLRAWDRVKFARAESSAEEARRGDKAVEELVRRWMPAPVEKVA